MDLTDELAGVVDLFGALTRAELERALAETAFRDGGKSVDAEVFDAAVEDALESFALVRYERGESTPDHATDESEEDPGALFVAGPTAFPSVPEHAEDLPHILEVTPRSLDRGALGEHALERFRTATARAIDDGDEERTRELLDVSYDLEAWAPIDLTDERERLDEALE